MLVMDIFRYIHAIIPFISVTSPENTENPWNICLQWVKGTVMPLYNNKYMRALTQITNTEIFTFITILVFKLLDSKVLFINKKDNRNC